MKNRLLILSALTAWAASTQAQVIFDNGPWGTPSNSETAFFETVYDPGVGMEIPTGRYRVLSQSFTTPASGVTATAVTITIRGNAHGAGTVPVVLGDGVGQIFYGGPVDFVGGETDYTFTLDRLGSPFTFLPNTRYELTLGDVSSFSGFSLDWYYAPTDSPEVASFNESDGFSYQSGEYVGDFTLRIAVAPEPGQFALIGALGLGAWAVVRRRGWRPARDAKRNSLAKQPEAEAKAL